MSHDTYILAPTHKRILNIGSWPGVFLERGADLSEHVPTSGLVKILGAPVIVFLTKRYGEQVTPLLVQMRRVMFPDALEGTLMLLQAASLPRWMSWPAA